MRSKNTRGKDICVPTSFFMKATDMEKIQITIDGSALERYEKVYFAKHPKARKSPIANPYHESINQWFIMKRPMMNALKQRWKDFICWLMEEQGYAGRGVERCTMKFTTYYKTNRRHDTDNSVPKFILDGFSESGFIVDDDSKHLTSLTLECYVDAANPRTEILVEPW